MTQVKFKVVDDLRRDIRTKKGRIIKEYPRFYLIQTESGYRECIDKAQLITGEIERVM